MQNMPQPAGRAELLEADAVEQIMPGDHGQPDGGDGPAGQIDKSREQHHRGADRPDDLRDHEVEMEVEAPANAHQRELEQDEPEPAAGEKTADVADAAAARAMEKSGNAGQKDERRRAEMRDPPGEEQGRIGEVTRI